MQEKKKNNQEETGLDALTASYSKNMREAAAKERKKQEKNLKK